MGSTRPQQPQQPPLQGKDQPRPHTRDADTHTHTRGVTKGRAPFYAGSGFESGQRHTHITLSDVVHGFLQGDDVHEPGKIESDVGAAVQMGELLRG